jgi:superfamily II RNA helicase
MGSSKRPASRGDGDQRRRPKRRPSAHRRDSSDRPTDERPPRRDADVDEPDEPSAGGRRPDNRPLGRAQGEPRHRSEANRAPREPREPDPDEAFGSGLENPTLSRAAARSAEAPQLETEAGALYFKGLKLSRFQLEAVRAIEAGNNVLVSAPTGAGKTLVAEYAVADAVRRGRRCIYTAPIKALSNQKYRDFKADPSIDVGLMTGDVTIHPTAQVLVMTTEILRNSILEDPERLHDVEFVILDEVHYMDDPERGTVWEESLIFAPPQIRFISLSATISNLDQLGAWMDEVRPHGLTLVRSDRRPVPLKHRFYLHGVGLFDAHRLDWAKRQAQSQGDDKRRRGRKGRGKNDWQERRAERQREETQSLRELLDELQRDDLLPVLAFAFSRRDCERLALANKKRELLDSEERERMIALQEELIELFQLDRGELQGEIFRLARRGIGFHHAGMLPVHKEVVERMFTSGLLKLLFTTETFALGINMPARTAVFFGLKKFDGVSFDYLRTRDYMQMAGRAGRQGIDSEGLVVSRVDARDLEDAPLKRLVQGKPEAVASKFRLSYSTLLHLMERVGRERLFEAWEKSFDRFQHRAGSKKAREVNRREQRRFINAHLDLLSQAGYIDEHDKLTDKGRVARCIYGFELQITELLWRGALENLGSAPLAMIFVALIFEERRRFEETYVSPQLYGGVRRHATQVIARIAAEEARAGVPSPMKTLDWGLSPCVVGWVGGQPLEELEPLSSATPGDLVRTFRMAIQLMRQTLHAIDSSWDLHGLLTDAISAMDRDEVDARRQLELG